MARPNPKSARYLPVLLLTALLGACGGSRGGPDDSPGSNNRNQPPTISGTASTTATVGQTYSFQPTASDPEGKQLTFSVSGKPNWANFDTGTGLLEGTPAASDAGTSSSIVISVTDGQNTESLAAFALSVVTSGTGTATLRWVAPTTNVDGSALTNLAGYRIRYGRNLSNLDQSVTIAGAATTTYKITGLTTGTWYFTLSAFTNVGVESQPSMPASKTIG